jgi:Domain of unknown function (DUF4062)
VMAAIQPAFLPRLVVKTMSDVGPSSLPVGQKIDSTKGLELLALIDALSLRDGTGSARAARARWRPTPWVFISSVRQGAEAYREKTTMACLRKRMLPVGMETWSAMTTTPEETCRQRVREADLVILLLVHRYGAIEPKSGKSYTELEYDESVLAKKDILAFEATAGPTDPKAQNTDPDDRERFRRFREQLGTRLQGKAETPADLGLLVYQSLDEWLQGINTE